MRKSSMVTLALVAVVCAVSSSAMAQCKYDVDCVGEEWIVDCPGNWDCIRGECREVCDFVYCGDGFCDVWAGESSQSCTIDCADRECNGDFDCIDLPWILDCGGHWDCRLGMCMENCMDNQCGNGFCEPYLGESVWSCPIDCKYECDDDFDCIDQPWLVDCLGHWDCLGGMCFEKCDNLFCGNGRCEPHEGESVWSCPSDCDHECDGDIDCIAQPWLIDCPGHWDCLGEMCFEVCDGQLCGDGVCQPELGESEMSCSEDCAYTGQCAVDYHCLSLPWLVNCLGDWDCINERCVPNCNNGTCGDRVCDPLVGEGPMTCPTDCGNICQYDIDCILEDWLVDCLGNWDCRRGACVENCDFVTCGDGFCDLWQGESVQSCPGDCK